MSAAFDDAALVEHQYLVGIHHGRQAVGDHQRGAADGGLFELGLDGLLGLRIERGSGLVENHDSRVLQQRPCNGDALLFAAGELQAAFAHPGLVAIRQAGDELVQLGGARSRDHLGLGRPGPAVLDVVVDGVVEQHRILRHDADCRAQRALGKPADVAAIDADAAIRFRRIHVIETIQQARQRALARAAVADHGHRLAGRDSEVDIEQYLPLGLVAETDVLESDGAGSGRQ